MNKIILLLLLSIVSAGAMAVTVELKFESGSEIKLNEDESETFRFYVKVTRAANEATGNSTLRLFTQEKGSSYESEVSVNLPQITEGSWGGNVYYSQSFNVSLRANDFRRGGDLFAVFENYGGAGTRSKKINIEFVEDASTPDPTPTQTVGPDPTPTQTVGNNQLPTLPGQYMNLKSNERYSGAQDSSRGSRSSVTVSNDGHKLTLEGSRWRALEINYTITENTILEFDFSSSREGEIQGIGFDSNKDLEDDQSEFFQLYGWHNFGISAYRTYRSGTMHYRIPVGQFIGHYTLRYLVFISDDDAHYDSRSVFSNIELWEDDGTRVEAAAKAARIGAALYPLFN